MLESEPGRGVQQNAGARHATGDVLLFQHADTWLDASAGLGTRRDERPACGLRSISAANRSCRMVLSAIGAG